MKNILPKKQDFKKVVETSTKKELAAYGVPIFTDYKESILDGEKYLKPNEIHYLFPVEWFDIIPIGYNVVSILGRKQKFSKSFSKDARCGALSYGFIRNFK